MCSEVMIMEDERKDLPSLLDDVVSSKLPHSYRSPHSHNLNSGSTSGAIPVADLHLAQGLDGVGQSSARMSRYRVNVLPTSNIPCSSYGSIVFNATERNVDTIVPSVSHHVHTLVTALISSKPHGQAKWSRYGAWVPL